MPDKYGSAIQVGFGVNLPWHSVQDLENALHHALAVSGQYVWLWDHHRDWTTPMRKVTRERVFAVMNALRARSAAKATPTNDLSDYWGLKSPVFHAAKLEVRVWRRQGLCEKQEMNRTTVTMLMNGLAVAIVLALGVPLPSATAQSDSAAKVGQAPFVDKIVRRVAAKGFNTIVTTSTGDQCLDLAAEHGLHVIQYADTGGERFRKWVTGLREYPALLGWGTCDEPSTEAIVKHAQVERYAQVRAYAGAARMRAAGCARRDRGIMSQRSAALNAELGGRPAAGHPTVFESMDETNERSRSDGALGTGGGC